MRRLLKICALLALAEFAQAAVLTTGEAVVRNGVSVQGVYIQEVKMTGDHGAHGAHGAHGQGHGAAEMPGMHLEAAITMAEAGHGFPVGSWVPYLNVRYTLAKKGGDWTAEGPLVPMLANDGPHYGANVSMPGPGKYVLTFHVAPPSDDVFPRHFDRETGVGPWLGPFEASWEFTYVGIGKKGGY
ncbi:MAG: iron transporter [Ectothiorhodospiraceae bacterium]|nr:iron transporter [Chromatiales bacterium]MCP5154847.1 iron transporter [Ectothiorhodospiraceae bacterium]